MHICIQVNAPFPTGRQPEGFSSYSSTPSAAAPRVARGKINTANKTSTTRSLNKKKRGEIPSMDSMNTGLADMSIAM